MKTKKCIRCSIEYKLTSEFWSKRSSAKDGFYYYCKTCRKKERSIHKDKTAKYDKERYEKNKKKIAKQKKEASGLSAKYSTYKDQLFVDKIRKTDNDFLEVKCKHCKKWFKPINRQVRHRVQAINGKSMGEKNFYCSQECKDNCEVYGKSPRTLEKQDELNAGIYTVHKHEGFYTESQLKIWSKEVRNKANNECEKCGSKDNLQSHHINPKSTYPEKALEPDNGVCVCLDCHKNLHDQSGCKTGQLRKCDIKENI